MPLWKNLLLSIFLFSTTGLPSSYCNGLSKQPKVLYLSNFTSFDQVRSDSARAMLDRICNLQNLYIERYDLRTGLKNLPPLTQYSIIILSESPVYSVTNMELRRKIEQYLLGDEDRSGGSLLLIFSRDRSQLRRGSDQTAWKWFMQLTSPEFLKIQSHKNENLMDLALMASSTEREESIRQNQISFFRQLPHPVKKSNLEGGKIFLTYLGQSSFNFSRDKRGQYNDPCFVSHISEAVKWQIGIENPDKLNIDHLDLSGWPDKDQVRLSWMTKADSVLKNFSLFRADNDQSWENIYRVACSVGEGEWIEFEYLDREKMPGRYYYQLKGKTANRSNQSSRILVVDIGGLHPELTLFPNPANHSLFVNIGLLRNSKVQLSIESRLGEKLLVRDLGNVNNGHEEKLAIGHFLPGLYILRVRAGEMEAVKNFIKYE